MQICAREFVSWNILIFFRRFRTCCFLHYARIFPLVTRTRGAPKKNHTTGRSRSRSDYLDNLQWILYFAVERCRAGPAYITGYRSDLSIGNKLWIMKTVRLLPPPETRTRSYRSFTMKDLDHLLIVGRPSFDLPNESTTFFQPANNTPHDF